MANVTKSVIAAGGGDYTTIKSALNSSDVSGGWYKIEIQDNSEYVENLLFDVAVGTPSITNYIWLTAAAANRHSGIAGTGHARIRNTSKGKHCIRFLSSFSRVEYLEIRQDSTGASDEGIRLDPNVTDVLISRCVIWTSQSAADQDGVYLGGWSADCCIDNCVIYGFSRANIHPQNYQGTGAQTIEVDYCTLYDGGASGEPESGAIYLRPSTSSGGSITLGVYNTIGCATAAGYTDFADGTGSNRGNPSNGTCAWNGSHNLHTSSLAEIGDGARSTDNTTSWQDASAGGATTTTTTTSAVIFTSLTALAEDFSLQAATGSGSNLAIGNGVSRVGSEPDSRQDFSTDIAGNPRSLDIGAFQTASTAGGKLFVTNARRNALRHHLVR